MLAKPPTFTGDHLQPMDQIFQALPTGVAESLEPWLNNLPRGPVVFNALEFIVLIAPSLIAKVYDMNEQRICNGFAPARRHIGIESGQARVEDWGTLFPVTCTAVGACVNSVSKFQAAAKNFSYDILDGEVAAPTTTVTPLIKVGDSL